MSGLSAVAGVVLSVFGSDQVLLPLLGFEAVTIVAGVLGALVGFGLLGGGVPVGALCVAGTIVMGSVFGSISVQHAVGGTSLVPFVVLRAVLGGAVLLGATIVALGPTPAGWRRLAVGLALSGPVLFAVGLIALGRGRSFTGPLTSMPPAALWAGGLVAFVVASVVFAVGVDLLIRAFDPDLQRRVSGKPRSGSRPA
ncbi:MAG: hypothetical protein AAF108_09890 [Planctomycetota bacterium]